MTHLSVVIGTYYDAGLGACGIVNANTDYIAAVSKEVFDGYGQVAFLRVLNPGH